MLHHIKIHFGDLPAVFWAKLFGDLRKSRKPISFFSHQQHAVSHSAFDSGNTPELPQYRLALKKSPHLNNWSLSVEQ